MEGEFVAEAVFVVVQDGDHCGGLEVVLECRHDAKGEVRPSRLSAPVVISHTAQSRPPWKVDPAPAMSSRISQTDVPATPIRAPVLVGTS